MALKPKRSMEDDENPMLTLLKIWLACLAAIAFASAAVYLCWRLIS